MKFRQCRKKKEMRAVLGQFRLRRRRSETNSPQFIKVRRRRFCFFREIASSSGGFHVGWHHNFWIFLPLRSFCPKCICCLSANFLHFLTPAPSTFSADVLYGSPLPKATEVGRVVGLAAVAAEIQRASDPPSHRPTVRPRPSD